MNSWPEYPSEIENLLDTTLMTFMNLVHRSLLSVPFPLLDGVDGQVSSTRSRISCSCSTATISRSQALLQHTMAGQDSVRHLFFFSKERHVVLQVGGIGVAKNCKAVSPAAVPATPPAWPLDTSGFHQKRTVKPFLPIILIRGDQDLIAYIRRA